MPSKILQILIPGGNPNGLKIIELAGWTGKSFIIPRQNLKELKDRPEINQPALYLLFGVDEESGEDLVYIGESESFYSRITNHDTNKDFWDTAVVFCGGLNRAFVKYLEYRATTLANEADRMRVENKIQPQENTLSEFEKISIEQYFDNVKFILSAFSYELFEKVEESLADHTMYYLKSSDYEARAQLLSDGSLNVLKGSVARERETESFGGWSKAARQKFLNDGTLEKTGGGLLFTRDIVFKSPSSAAATIVGRSINGWTAWKDDTGNTLDENLRK